MNIKQIRKDILNSNDNKLIELLNLGRRFVNCQRIEELYAVIALKDLTRLRGSWKKI